MKPQKMNHEIVNAMLAHGGRFACSLANLWIVADQENREKIETTWPDFGEKYAKFVKTQTAK